MDFVCSAVSTVAFRMYPAATTSSPETTANNPESTPPNSSSAIIKSAPKTPSATIIQPATDRKPATLRVVLYSEPGPAPLGAASTNQFPFFSWPTRSPSRNLLDHGLFGERVCGSIFCRVRKHSASFPTLWMMRRWRPHRVSRSHARASYGVGALPRPHSAGGANPRPRAFYADCSSPQCQRARWIATRRAAQPP